MLKVVSVLGCRGGRLPVFSTCLGSRLGLVRVSQVANAGVESTRRRASLQDKDLTREEVFVSRDVLWRNCERHLNYHRGSEHDKMATNKLLHMLRRCGGPTLAEAPNVKVKLADDIWQRMTEEGIKTDVGIYNIMLRIYNNNDHNIVPSEILEEMKAKDILPNMGTFGLLIDAYCRQGNINGATKLIDYLKSMEMSISEPICASLVTGHARAGNMQAAEDVLTAMKSSGQVPHNVVYTRLLCAYAERGDIDAVERVFGQMRSERLFPSMTAYTEVMDTLSKYGHGALVTRILALIKNKEWLSADLRVLISTCVSRGEVEAPRILFKQLVENRAYGVDRYVLVMYIAACLEQGQSLEGVMKDLKTEIGLSYSPQELQQLYNAIAERLLFKHPPQVVGEVLVNRPPAAGDLAPHVMGTAWSQHLLNLYRLMKEDRDAVNFDVPVFYYYPLLARHCSDVNMEGFMVTLKQMLMTSGSSRISEQYVYKMMSNADTTMQDYLDAELAKLSEDEAAVADVALTGFLHYCSSGNFKEAQQLVKYFQSSDLLSKHSVALSKAVARGCLSSIDLTGDLVQLFKLLSSLFSPPDLTACLHHCSASYRGQGPVAALVKLFSALEHEGLKVVDAKCYLDLLPKLSNFDRSMFLEIFKKVKEYELKESDYVTMFLHAVRTRRFGVANSVYQCLSPDTLERADIRTGFLTYLCFQSSPTCVTDAVKLLEALLSEGCVPHYTVWNALIPQVALMDVELADYLVQQMKSCGEELNQGLRHKLLEIYANKGNHEKAKLEFDAIVSNGWVGATSCSLMAASWAELGNVEEIQNVIKMAETKGIPTSGNNFDLGLFLLKAQLKRGDRDGVLQSLQTLKLSKTLATAPNISPLLAAYLQASYPVEAFVAFLKESSLSPSVVNSLLFFGYVDCNDTEAASATLKETDALDVVVFQNQMSNSNAAEYMRILKMCDYHLRDIKAAYLMKSGYVKLNDTEGIKELRQSLEKESKTEWLWTLM